jgi:Cof subfamily protein (haloacid dehalogenase superfamily)
MIKLIFTDLDGTLLKNDKSMPADTQRVFRELANRGVICGIATGRSLPSLHRDFGGLGELAYIAENGAIAEYKGEILYKEIMSTAHVHTVLDTALTVPKSHIVLACAKYAYTNAHDEHILEHFRMYYPNIKPVENLYAVKDDILKIAFYSIERKADVLASAFTELTQVAQSVSGVDWIDFLSIGVNKGRGIAAFQTKFGIARDEIMAFGDYMNDYELLQSVGESYAMDNAHPGVKAVSKHVIGTNEDEAVIKTLIKHFEL